MQAKHNIWLNARAGGVIAVGFSAMASPCEILLATEDTHLAQQAGQLAAAEAWRIEAKYSRYRSDSELSRLNHSQGQPVTVDAETAALLDFAQLCYQLSDGLFDITSGALRRAWRFDGSDRLPDPAAVQALLPLIGFSKLVWQSPHLTLPSDMELDFGGIGKEYAVDRVLALLTARFQLPILVNFGGDLCTNGCPGTPWQIGVERPGQIGVEHPGEAGATALLLPLERGALATSGDSHRFLLKNGVRYSHILDPRTGWPVPNALRSVTVAGANCLEAGMLATLALLHGGSATSFLEQQQARYWCLS